MQVHIFRNRRRSSERLRGLEMSENRALHIHHDARCCRVKAMDLW